MKLEKANYESNSLHNILKELDEVKLINHLSNTQDDILKSSTDPLYFIENILGLKLYDCQKSMLNEMIDSHLVIKESHKRRQGYTTLFCAYAIWYAIFNFREIVAINCVTANDMMMASRILYDFYEKIPKDLTYKLFEYRRDKLHFENGSKIIINRHIDHYRGCNIDLALIDDLNRFQTNKEEFLSCLYPIFACKPAKKPIVSL